VFSIGRLSRRRFETPAVIPLEDDVPSQTVPVVTMALVTLNVLVFCYQLSLQMGADSGCGSSCNSSRAT
jgi:hypothetical protein